MTAKKAKTFSCYWCARELGLRKLHHRQRGTDPERPCCTSCHADPDGAYRSIYPGGETEETKSIAAVQAREMEKL